jgi:hypothetical protein
MRCAPLGIAAAAAMAAALMLVGDGLAQVAEDGVASPPKVRVAAVGAEAPGAPDRQGVGSSDANIDLRMLLAQSAPAAAAESQSRDDTVLVSFPISTPRGVEDEVIREHGLEVVGRWELARFELRMVQLRVPPGRSVAALLADLRVDRRVKSAQANNTFRPATTGGGGRAKDGSGGIVQPKPEETSQASASPSRPYGIAAALGPGGPTKTVHGGRALGARSYKPGGPFASASAPAALQLLTADEPFVGADGRLR